MLTVIVRRAQRKEFSLLCGLYSKDGAAQRFPSEFDLSDQVR